MARPLTAAVAGAGVMAGVHATAAALAGVKVIAVAARSPEHAGDVARRIGARPVRQEDLPAGTDIVVVASPPATHAAHALRAMAAGAAVVVETPLCTTLADADLLVATADGAGHRALYAENLAYAPVMHEFVRRTRSLGPLNHLEVRAMNPRPTWGDHGSRVWGGGAFFDLGVHALAVAVLAASPARPVEVLARLEPVAGGDPSPLDEHADVRVRFDTGLSVHLVASHRGETTPMWDAQAASPTGVVRAELAPAPALEVNGDPVPLPTPTSRLPALEQVGYRGEWAAFVEDLRRGRRPVMDLTFGRMMLDLICAGYASARTGRPERTPFSGPRDLTPLQLWHGR